MTEKPIENEATREARKRGVKGAFRPSMTDADRQEAGRVWKSLWLNPKYSPMGNLAMPGPIDTIAAARVRWQNEALEEAASEAQKWPSGIGAAQAIRALKK